MSVELKFLKDYKPNELVLVTGLPGTAYVGKLTVDYLVKELKAELVAEIYSKHFPPYVIIKENGVVELLRNELHMYRDENGRDIAFLSGNSQAFSPDGQYEIADAVLDWAVSNGVKKVFSVAALVTDKEFENPSVFCTGTSIEVIEELKKFGVQALDRGVIGGENGLILGLAKKRNLEGACLLGESHGYQTSSGEYVLDAKAAKATLTVLDCILNLKVNMEPMDKQAAQMDELMAKMAEIERNMREEMAKGAKKPSYVT